MKLSLFGVGNAGTRIVDQLVGGEHGTDQPFATKNVLAFNTTPSAFETADHIPEDRQVVVGDTHPEVVAPEPSVDDGDRSASPTGDGEAAGDSEAAEEPAGDERETVRREGVAGDPELGVEVAEDDLPEIRRALDQVDDTEVDAAVIVAGLGGGTGCGVGAVLLEELKAIYEIPVYVLGVLPSSEESDQRAWTAARAVRTFVPLADAVFPIDNEVWSAGSAAVGYEAANSAIATRLSSLFAAGEREDQALSEIRMDPNDMMRTLAVGGIATLGYAETELSIESEGWFARLRRLLGFDTAEPEPQTDAKSIKQLVKRAVGSTLTLPCDVSTADRVLLILSGPPGELSRKGFETGRKLLEDETGTVEILAGDEPLTDASTVTATVLLSNVTGVPRLEAIQERAVAFQRQQDAGSTETTRPADDDQPNVTDQSAANDHGFDFEDNNLGDSSDDEPSEWETEPQEQ